MKIYIALLSLSVLVFAGCGPKPLPPAQPVPVNTISVKAMPVTYYDRYPATTVALSQVNLLAQVQGYITGIYFKEGSHVKKGQKLYEIDRRIYANNYNAALANLKVAQGTLTQAQQDEARYEYLNKEKAVARQQYEHAQITLQNSQNSVKAAEEGVNNAATNLTYSNITAPFDGTIGFSQVKMGDLMNVGQTVLNTISTDDPMAVDILINEKQLTYFEDIQKDKANTDSLFTLILPDNSTYKHTGKISVIDRAVDPQTGAVRVRLVFDNPEFYLRAGMSCVVRVKNRDTRPQMLIPSKAIVEQMGEYFVFVVKDTAIVPKDANATSEQSSKAEKRRGIFAFQKKVHTGETIGPDVIIKDGISEGDKIIVDGIQSLHDGSEVNPGKKDGASRHEPDNTAPAGKQ